MLTVEDCIIKSLTDRSHVVRMKAAEFVRYLFQSPQQSYVAPLRQQAVFNKVADALTELIMIKVCWNQLHIFVPKSLIGKHLRMPVHTLAQACIF